MKTDILGLSTETLGRLMPMFLLIDPRGKVLAEGPTMARVLDRAGQKSRNFLDIFRLRRPSGVTSVRRLGRLLGERIQLDLKVGEEVLALRGLCVELEDGKTWLVNLSFGINVVEAVRVLGLNDADFASTDLAIEMLYLVEAKSAVMRELRDLNQRLQGAKQAAEFQAQTDTLTGLKNRRALENEMLRLIDRGIPFALMHIDLDFFKAVNDRYGHAAGDHVLRVVSDALRQETRDTDTVARVGGDEFVIVLPLTCDDTRLAEIGWRIIKVVSQPIPFEGNLCRIAASIGITRSDHYALPSVDQLNADADAALYESKGHGRGLVSLHDPSRPTPPPPGERRQGTAGDASPGKLTAKVRPRLAG